MELFNISYHGVNKKPQINLSKAFVKENFSRYQREIEVIIEGTRCVTSLPDSFFEECCHLRTAYVENKRENYLTEWI